MSRGAMMGIILYLLEFVRVMGRFMWLLIIIAIGICFVCKNEEEN